MPGMRSQAARARRCGSAWMAAAICASRSARWSVSQARWASRLARRAGGVWGRRCCSATRMARSWRRRVTRACRSRVAASGRGAPAAGPRPESRQHPGVEAVGFGQDVAAAGEVAHLPRIDHHRRQPGRDERGVDRPLVAATGFQHDPGGLQRLARRTSAAIRHASCVGWHATSMRGRRPAEIRGLGHFGTLRRWPPAQPWMRARVATVPLDQRGPGRTDGLLGPAVCPGPVLPRGQSAGLATYKGRVSDPPASPGSGKASWRFQPGPGFTRE